MFEIITFPLEYVVVLFRENGCWSILGLTKYKRVNMGQRHILHLLIAGTTEYTLL